jgi:hypothetical protein
MFLIGMLAPNVASQALGRPACAFGLLLGAGAWILRAATAGVPRMTPDLELGVVLDIVSLWREDPASLAGAELLYRERVLAPAARPKLPPSRRAAA